MPPRTLHVFRDHEGNIYTSINRQDPPPVYLAESENIHGFVALRHTQSTQWFSNAFPFLGFAPAKARFTGPLFERLALKIDALPVAFNETTNTWSLPKDLGDRWQRLESGLYWTIKKLTPTAQSFIHTQTHISPTLYRWFDLPFRYGYTKPWPTKEAARRQIMRARRAFILLMSMCSWVLAHFPLPHEGLESSPPWLCHLVDIENVHPQWAENLRLSDVGDFAIERLGTIFNPFTCQWQGRIDVMHRSNVALWVFWGKDLQRPVAPDVVPDYYRPTSEQVQSAVYFDSNTVLHSYIHSPTIPFHRLSNPSAGTSRIDDLAPPWFPSGSFSHSDSLVDSAILSPILKDRYPPALPGCRQMYGETWQQYFERLKQNRPARLAVETPQARASRVQREQAAARHLAPGRKGPRVFCWEPHPHFHGFRVRTQVSHAEVEDLWGSYGNQQRRFNSFDNEWDICTEFDPLDISDDALMDRYIGLDADDDPHPGDMSALMAFDDLPPLDDRLDLRTEHNAGSAHATSPDTKMNGDSMVETLRSHYGLYANPVYATLQPVAEKRWWTVRMILGQAKTAVEDNMWQHAATALVDHYSNNSNSQFLAPLRDLYDKNAMTKLFRSSNVVVSVHNDITGAYYLIKGYLQDETSWQVMTRDAAAVLHCVRARWGPHTTDVASNLARRGMGFHTFAPVPLYISVNPRQMRSTRLGARPVGYTPDAFEYTAYETRRDKFLTEPHARAAILAGGIVWRLALESLPIDTPFSGPSERAYTHGLVLNSPDLGKVCDDALTTEEMDLICGVYKVYTCAFSF